MKELWIKINKLCLARRKNQLKMYLSCYKRVSHNLMIEAYNKTLYYQGDKVKISLKTEIPEKFYKYYSLSFYSVKNLVDKNIHFSHPYNLNDIMDGNLQLWDLEEFYQEVMQESKCKIDEFAFRKDIVQNKSFEFYKHRGVLCLTDSFDNNLFWPHYTSEQGFCLEFNSKKFLNSFKEENIKTFPISYQPLRKINLSENINKKKELGKANIDVNLPILYALSFKDEIWKYENEWRVLLTKKNLGGISHPLNPINDIDFMDENENIKKRNIPFNSDSINKVILSNLFFHKK